MSNNSCEVSFVIPSLNEVETIGRTIEEIPTQELEEMGYDTEIIVVDGLSKDGTRDLAQRKGAQVIIERRKGYGYAYMRGFKHAKGDIIIAGDADATYPFNTSAKLIKRMERDDLDLIITNRLIKQNREAFPPIKLTGNKLLSFLTKLLFNLHINDSQSGMWVFKKDLLDGITFRGKGMEFSTEFKLLAIGKSEKYLELPINYRPRKTGTSKVEWYETGVKVALFLLKKRILSLLSNT